MMGFVLLHLAILNANSRAEVRYELRLAQNALAAGRDYYQKLAGLTEQMQILRHDSRHHINALNQLLQHGDSNTARDYIGRLEMEYAKTDLPEYCANRTVNALLESFAARCLADGIRFEARAALSAVTGVDDYDLCIVLGNLFENAADACCKLPQGERYVSIEIKIQGGQMGILVQNGFDGVMKEQAGGLASRKQEGGGLGIRSVRAVAGRYGGAYYPEWTGNVFSAYVLLGLHKKADGELPGPPA